MSSAPYLEQFVVTPELDRSDAELMRLPAPKRIAVGRVAEIMWQAVAPSVVVPLRERLTGNEDPLGLCLDSMASAAPFARLAGENQKKLGSINNGTSLAMLHFMKYDAAKGRLFETTDELEDLLRDSDIGEDCPAQFFRPPYPSIYIAFGESRTFPVFVNNSLSGDHRVEGVFVSESKTTVQIGTTVSVMDARNRNMKEGEPCRVLSLLICGCPKASFLDDATLGMDIFIPESDEDKPLLQLIEGTLKDMSRDLQGTESTPPSLAERKVFHAVMEHAAKILLYLNCSNVRQQLETRETELRARVTRVGPGKKAKLERKLERAYDRVLVQTPASEKQEGRPETMGTHASPKAHWRRGHFRSVRYGPGKTERRPKLIPRVLVNLEKLGQDPMAKDYSVGA